MGRLFSIKLLALGLASFALMPSSLAAPSAGCDQEAAEPPELIDVDGRWRHAIVALPNQYRSDRPHTLIFGFHGRTNDNARARSYFDLEQSPSHPTIYVYPAGLADETGNFSWWTIGEPPDALRDFSLFDALLASMSAGFCIDRHAVYVVGHSLGASFANSLACARAGRIRGVISVAGGINGMACRGEAAAMIVHNPRDEAVPVAEGERARDALLGPGAADMIGQKKIGPFACDQYREGPDPLFWCLHDQDVTGRGRYYPHQWPSGMADAVAAFIDMTGGGPDRAESNDGQAR